MRSDGKGDGKGSRTQAVASKLEAARATKRPVEVCYDEVDCLLDTALAHVRSAGESGQRQIRDLASTLRKIPA